MAGRPSAKKICGANLYNPYGTIFYRYEGLLHGVHIHFHAVDFVPHMGVHRSRFKG